MTFRDLHQQPTPLLIANAWDVPSVKAAAQAGYAAIATSSSAIADLYGYPDGQAMPFERMLDHVARMMTATTLPFSVDIEAGYADEPAQIAAHIGQLAAMGVVGVNLEDSEVVDGQRRLMPADAFAARLSAVRAAMAQAGVDLFLNIRTDPFLLGMSNARDESIARGLRYAAAGADGLFVPCVVAPDDIATLVAAVALPLNVMCMPSLPGFARLAELGVKRISMGNFVHAQLQAKLQAMLADIARDQSFDTVFGHAHH
jgi:2-methylisocitrate lyase-like PEP mutase family enzyme